MTTSATIPPEIASLIIGIDHIGIAVPDLTEALQFYEGILGLHSHHTETNEEQGVEEAMLQFPAGGKNGPDIQLLSPLGPDTTIGRFITKNGPGIQQLALRVTDIKSVAEILHSRGIRMLYPEPRIGTAGSLVNFAHPKDCGGVLLEFVQHQ
jgi:methylmalonyl-CoA/ethylmalonyl-CoA epimerase